MPLTAATAMLSQIVIGLSRLLPQAPEREAVSEAWSDSETGWHNSSYALANGLQVIEHFDADAVPLFPDTLPACHWPAPSAR